MTISNSTRYFLGLTTALIFAVIFVTSGQAAERFTLLAFRPPAEIRQVAPPREIREVAPPREMRRVAPPREMREVAPPREIRRVHPPRDVRRGTGPPQMERRHITPPRELRPARIHRPVFRPDLRVRAIGLSSTRPKVGERVVVTARIRNSGNESARRFRVRFFADGQQIGEETASLAPGATETLTVAFVAVTPGSQQVRVQVEPGSGKGKQVASSRGLTVQSVSEGTKVAQVILAESLERDKRLSRKLGKDHPRVRTLEPGLKRNLSLGSELEVEPEVSKIQVPETPEAAGRGAGGTPEQKLARLPDYRTPLDKPQAKPKAESPKGGSELGDLDKPGGRGTDDFGSASPLPDWLPGSSFKDQDLEGPFGKGPRGSKGDGIQGLHDQDSMPEVGRGPGHTYGDKGLPGGGRGTAGHGFGKDRYGAPIIKHNIGGAYDDTQKKEDAVADAMLRTGASMVFHKDGKVIGFWEGKDGYAIVHDPQAKEDSLMTIEEAQLVFSIGTGKPGPEGQDTVHPKQQPQLLAKIAKEAPQKPKLRPDEGVSDPAGTKLGKAAEAQAPSGGRASSAAGTQAGADIKWKFIGKKPGSEVTDPAEPQGTGSHGTPDSYRAPQGFLVIDPAEPEAASIRAALATAQATAAKGASGQTAAVASVTGSVQKLTEQGGKQGWVPLKPGDNLGQGSIIRVDKNTGGEVGFSSLTMALSQSFSKIHDGSNHNVYLVNTIAK